MAEPTAYQKVGTTALDVTEAGKKELWYLEFDGVDDTMMALSFTINQPATRISSIKIDNNDGRCFSSGASNGRQFFRASDTSLSMYDESILTLTEVDLSVVFVATETFNDEDSSLKAQGKTATGPAGDGITGSNSGITLFSRNGNLFGKGHFYGAAYVDRLLTDGESDKAALLLASRSGVELP